LMGHAYRKPEDHNERDNIFPHDSEIVLVNMNLWI
jgi:hypothetical protein